MTEETTDARNDGLAGELKRKDLLISSHEATIRELSNQLDLAHRELGHERERHRLELENIQLRLEQEFSKMPESQTPYLDKALGILTKAVDYEKELQKRG
jgi:hypothetical protein